jgi:hypothetical protein
MRVPSLKERWGMEPATEDVTVTSAETEPEMGDVTDDVGRVWI